MRPFYLIASAPLLLAALLPIGAALVMAHRQAEEEQIGQLTALADEVLRRGIASRTQLVAALDEMDRRSDPPCSEESLLHMQQIVGTSYYLQGMGSMVGNRLVCSTLMRGREPIPLPGPPVVTGTGLATWIGARLPFAPQQPFNLYARHGQVVIIHPGIVIDIPLPGPDVALGLAITAPRSLIREKGPLQREWLDLFPADTNGRVETATHYVVYRASKANNLGAVAAVPKAAARAGLRQQALVLAPLGLGTSALLAFGVAALTRRQLSPQARLRAALRRGEFFVAYQPIVHLASGRWVGAEALVRWRRGDGTLVPPDEFIAEAEKAGVISLITRFVMDRVLADLPEMLRVRPGFHVSVNLSAQDLVADGPVQYLRDRFEALGLPPGSLMLEVTERGVVDIDAARPAWQAARAIGASIALDDFGTGYSSLSVLESMALDKLKIDRAFIASIGEQAAISPVTQHIIEMAHKLRLELIAEGIETQEQVDFLLARDVQHGQGWKFARAMPPHELLEALARQQREVSAG